MRTTIFSLLMACGVTAFGQFIPQPNAYNPDANGDSFIGVDDVMGTLALFNSPFNNGDSINTLEWTFSESVLIQNYDGSTDTIPDSYTTPIETLEIPEFADILVLKRPSAPDQAQDYYFTLPEGPGFKSLLVCGSTEMGDGPEFWFAQSNSPHVPKLKLLSPYRYNYLLFLRLSDGTWYSPFQ